LDLTPRQIVAELDKYIVGQTAAKRAVAIALRNRWRRQQLPADIRDEVAPKNILMIGPTGVGKTEIARRLARLANAPFIKVEATKFTEVGYVGRDVESIVRDLVETSIRLVKAEKLEEVRGRTGPMVEERILDILAPLPKKERPVHPLGALFGLGTPRTAPPDDDFEQRREKAKLEREHLLQQLRDGKLEDWYIELEVEDRRPQTLEVFSAMGVEQMGINLSDLFGGMLPKRTRRRKLKISEARDVIAQQEAEKLLDEDEVIAEAIRRAEETGIVFIDEIDKIASPDGTGHGPDVSREGVQRDILPIVEGSTVMTKYGPVRTDHVLFIAAGAFHVSKPSDLIPELQGRFPIRVELSSLDTDDFIRILTEPRVSLTRQYVELLRTEGVEVEFTEDGIAEIASLARLVNETTENIGARRLHTLMERLLEDVSFNAPDQAGSRIVVDKAFVQAQLADVVKDHDLSRYIL